MIKIAVLRHWPTQWNLEKRHQGRNDIPLLKQSIEDLKHLRIPSDFEDFEFYGSPLTRSQQTLTALNLTPFTIAPELVECDFGQWEGLTASEIKSRYPYNPSGYDGLHYKHHGGESVWDVQQRLLSWIQTLEQNSFVVTHKCVITSLYALATNWQIEGAPEHKLDFRQIQVFEFHKEKLTLLKLNQPLQNRSTH